MRKSQLKIIQNDPILIIRKKMDIVTVVIHAVICAAGISLPILFPNLRSLPIFWAVLIVCMLGNTASFLGLFLGKIVVDTEKWQISIYNWCRESYGLDEVKEINCVFEAGDGDGGPDQHKLVLRFNNGYKTELYTACKEQTEEIAELLNTILFPTESKEHTI